MLLAYPSSEKRYHNCLDGIKVLIQGNLFQKCAHFLYCSVLSLGGKVNTRRIVFKFSDGDGPNLFRVKKVDVVPHFLKIYFGLG